MIAKCPYCGGPLNFDPDIQKMVCDHCTRMFNVDEISEEVKINNVTKEGLSTYSVHMSDEDLTPAQDNVSEELMDCEIYECKSCGAKLTLNNVETATFCAFCGQPTIVFDRIAKRRRPKYIIPFVYSKEEALEKIKVSFSDGKYINQNMDNIKADMIRGIYIPYALFDIYYKDRQLLAAANQDACYYFRSGIGDYRQIPVDASSQFPNNLSELLEPYNTDNLTLFKSKYLSGYYADLRDEDFEMLKKIALARTVEMFNKQTVRTLTDKNYRLVKHDPKYEFDRQDYALFPAWFMVFNKNNKTYTILVNGQTGKVVGTYPYDEYALKSSFWTISILTSLISMIILFFLSRFSIGIIAMAALFIASITLFVVARIHMRSYKNKIKLTSGDEMMKYVKER